MRDKDVEYPSQERIREVLGPHHDKLANAVRAAYGVWADIAPKFQRQLARTRAQIISNAYYDRALAAFGAVTGVSTHEECERLLLVFLDEFVLRFKRLDRAKRTRNYPTLASQRMDAQVVIQIAGLQTLPRVVLGYTLSQLPEAIDGIYVLFAVSNEPMWAYSIDGSSTESLVLPFDEPIDSLPAHEFRMLGEAAEEDVDAEKKGG